MYKITLIVVGITMCGLLTAQPLVKSEKIGIDKSFTHSLAKSGNPTDTLFGNFFNGPSIIYTASGGGYVVGNNNYGDIAKAQQFVVGTSSYNVEGVLLWFGRKQFNSLSPNSKLQVNIYQMDGQGNTATGTGPAPGTVVRSTDLLMSVIDTNSNNMNAVMFSTPWYAFSDYAVGFDMNSLTAGDTVGMYSTMDSSGGNADLVWEQFSSGQWYTFLSNGSWALDLDIAIFPVINTNLSNIRDMGFINGIRMKQNQPNPSTNFTTITYELENPSDNVKLELYDVSGKRILILEEGTKGPGQHKLIVYTKKLNSGIYYYSLISEQKRLTMKMVVGK
jgi:hypothetical protein